MIKKCYVLDGKVINIGDWEYFKKQVEVYPADYDEKGNIVKDAVFKEVITNPLPEGAVEEQREFEGNDIGGWYEVGKAPINIAEQLKLLEETIKQLKGEM